MAKPIPSKDYGLTGNDTALAIERGLAEADWYSPPVPKERMHELLERRDWPAVRDTILWFALIIGSGWVAYGWWSVGNPWAIVPFLVYGTLYASSSDSRWHETSHGTAFKTDWLNDGLYEVASFMLMREATVWRWSHTRHHSDTNIVGRDPEIAVPTPPAILGLFLNEFFGLKNIPGYFWNLLLHSTGRLTADQKSFIPESEYRKVFVRAPIYLTIYAVVVSLAIHQHSILPLLFVGLPTLYGSWLLPIYATTQHAGLAENVLDHRLNCRTIYMSRINRYLYWNMNYHLEHHLFPLVPYHNLATLHEIVKPSMPTPYRSLWSAWSEVIPAVLRQVKEPSYCVKRELPPSSNAAAHVPHVFTAKGQPVNGWAEVCVSAFLKPEDVIRFDHLPRTYAIYRAADATLYATDGICTHGNTHLADGLVMGTLIECPKHNGRFDITDGSPQRQPACVALKTFKVREHDDKIFIDLASGGVHGVAKPSTTYEFRVVSNEYVATFIKELVLESPAGQAPPLYQPGDYLQFDIPAYGDIAFNALKVNAPFFDEWQARGLFELRSENAMPMRRNYSFATNPAVDNQFRFNVRIAMPPSGETCSAGAGSAYVHRLEPGDVITAIGPFGSFHIKPGDSEMIYVGGGAGMAPLRSHLSHLFESIKTNRRVSFWYGARSRKEIFYQDYFDALARRFPNFSFHLALSEPRREDDWTGAVGLIHELLRQRYLENHANPAAMEYYLCGPPLMIKATTTMLHDIGVADSQISFDEF
jgi:Na(+)-translocating NADH:ubiquinone oxidoreductase F subunit